MAKSKQGKKKNEGKRRPSAKFTKSKNGKLKQKATKMLNSKALESIYGSITQDSKNWGKRTRAMNEASAFEGNPSDQGSRKRQRPNFKAKNTRKPPPPKPQFRLRMPPAVPASKIPWWTKVTLKPSQKKMKLLNEIKVDSQAMSLLDHELKAFSTYVQLSAKEIETRDNLIGMIRNQAMERFGIRDSDVKVFGSYAARPVCTFESDIDLVIWGLVGNQQTWDSEQQEEDFQKEIAPLPATKEPQPEHSNMKKQNRILKWKAAIDEFEKEMVSKGAEKDNENAEAKTDTEASLAVDESQEVKDDSDTAPTAANSESPLSENGQFDDADEKSKEAGEITDPADEAETPFFIIDRFGDKAAEKDNENAEAKTAPTAANSESPLSENGQFDDADEKSKEAGEVTDPADEAETPFFIIDRFGDEPMAPQGESTESKAVTGADSGPQFPTNADEVAGANDISSADSDGDTADKLEGLKSRETSQLDTSGEGSEFHGLPLPDAEGLDEGTYFQEIRDAAEGDEDEEEDDEQEEDLITTPKTRSRSHSLVSLSSATTCSDNQMVNENGLEVSFITGSSPSKSIIARRPQKLSDNVRLIVNSKLNQLSKRIRKTGVATSIELRKWARVPILNMKTRFGYECDIGVGGHNGNDTSAYAGSQISQHPSFAPVVMVLKILLNQHDLDKPFTGGLGSFKLYVLVASHIQQHLTFGGSTTPSEILMTFFYRYGDIRSYRHVSPTAKTDLTRVDTVHCHDGGVVEISQVFQIENCVTVFRACWFTLMKALSKPTATSLLRLIVDARRLRERREAANSMVSHYRKTRSQTRGFVTSLARYSTNHKENKAISKLFKGGNKPFKNKHRGTRRKSK